MTTPAAPQKVTTLETGFSYWKEVNGKWIPARLFYTSRVRRSIRKLKGHA